MLNSVYWLLGVSGVAVAGISLQSTVGPPVPNGTFGRAIQGTEADNEKALELQVLISVTNVSSNASS